MTLRFTQADDPYAIDWAAFRESVEGRLHQVVRGTISPAGPGDERPVMTITLEPISSDSYERRQHRALIRSQRNSGGGRSRRRHGSRRGI